MKLFEKIKIGKEREIRFLGFPILQYGKKNIPNGTEKYIKLFPKSFLHKTLNKIIKLTECKYKNIIILRCGSGESTLFNFAINLFVKKNNITNFCLVTSNERTMSIDILTCYHSKLDIYVIDIAQEMLNKVLTQNIIKYKKTNFYVHLCSLNNMVKQLASVSGHTAKCANHPQFYLETLGIDKFEYYKIAHNEVIEKQLKSILPNLNFDNFVFLCPEATSVLKLNDIFWEDICNNLKKEGYDIFANTKNGYFKFAKSYKLSIKEALYLAKMSKAIIGLRSGFIELLAQLDIPKHIIYTPYKWQNFDEKTTYEYYTLKNYPFVKPEFLKEYMYKNYTSQLLSKSILNNLENIKE